MITRRFHANALWVNSKYQSELLALSATIREPIINVRPPDTLYHYTTSSGLIGIVGSRKLWATNALYLNDTTEMSYGYTIIRDNVKSARERSDDPDYSAFLQQAEGMLDDPNGPARDCYVTCFCERGDLLSQWRAYGNRGGGYSIGFSTREIGLNWVPPPNFFLRKVVYEFEKQNGIVDNALQLTYRAYGELIAGKQEEKESIRVLLWHFLQDHLHDLMLGYKHPGFLEEQEWRLIQPFHSIERDAHLDKVKFRAELSGIVPYIELDISPAAGVNKGRLPINKVRLGPALHPTLSTRAVTMILSKNQYHFVEVEQSEVPLRP